VIAASSIAAAHRDRSRQRQAAGARHQRLWPQQAANVLGTERGGALIAPPLRHALDRIRAGGSIGPAVEVPSAEAIKHGRYPDCSSGCIAEPRGGNAPPDLAQTRFHSGGAGSAPGPSRSIAAISGAGRAFEE